MELSKILGLKVVAIKGNAKTNNNKPKYIEPVLILFDDKKTYIWFEEQSQYDYHDCSSTAREINIEQDSNLWLDYYHNCYDANTDI